MARHVVPAMLVFLLILIHSSCGPPGGGEEGPGPEGPGGPSLTGTIFDRSTGEPVAGASVRFGGDSTETDIAGAFSLDLGTSGQELTETWCVHKDGYRFIVIQELTVDSSRSQVVHIGLEWVDPRAVPVATSLSGEIFDRDGQEIPAASTVNVYIYGADGARSAHEGLSYGLSYSLGTSVSSREALVVAVVEPPGDDMFVAAAAPVDFSASPVNLDLHAGDVDPVMVRAEKPGNTASCVYQTPYGSLIAPLIIQDDGPDTVASEWTFSSSNPEELRLCNPLGWDAVVWSQKEYDTSFPAGHTKFLLSLSESGKLVEEVVLPAIRMLGPHGVCDPASLDYSQTILSIGAVNGTTLYRFTVRQGDAGGDLLGWILATWNEVGLAPLSELDLDGQSIFVEYELIATESSPNITWVANPAGFPASSAFGVARSDLYGGVVDVPAAGTVDIGFE